MTELKKKDYTFEVCSYGSCWCSLLFNVSGLFAFGRSLASDRCFSSTHTGVVPFDVVKTRMQTDPQRYKSFIGSLVKIPREEGPRMLLKGAGPTAVGYFLQGAAKFGTL